MTEYIKGLREYVGHAPILQCGASVIVFDDQFRVLMIHRTDNDCWCFPGGSIELGENVRNAAIRETYEETGLKVEALELFDVFSGEGLYYKYPNGDEVHNVDIVFTSKHYSGEIIIENTESKNCCFFRIDQIPSRISPPVIPVVKKLIENFRNINI